MRSIFASRVHRLPLPGPAAVYTASLCSSARCSLRKMAAVPKVFAYLRMTASCPHPRTLLDREGPLPLKYDDTVRYAGEAQNILMTPTSSRITRFRSASTSTASNEPSIRLGPSSRRTSPAFRRRLGGKPTGLSSASSEAGRRKSLRVLKMCVWVWGVGGVGESWSTDSEQC